MCFPLLLFSIPLKNMFYNYLIFSMVALSLRIFKKYFVSSAKNISFHHMKTDCFSLLEQTVSLYLNKVFIAVN